MRVPFHFELLFITELNTLWYIVSDLRRCKNVEIQFNSNMG